MDENQDEFDSILMELRLIRTTVRARHEEHTKNGIALTQTLDNIIEQSTETAKKYE